MPEQSSDPQGRFTSSLTPEALAQRQTTAYKMRLSGASFTDIARVLNIDRRTASRDVAAVHEEMHGGALEEIECLRMQQADRLDLALFAIMPIVKKGHLGAIDRLLAIEKRRAELFGLDAPKRVEMTGKDGGPIESEQVPIRERWTPQEAQQKAEELLRRLEVAKRETNRISEEQVRRN